MPEYTKVEDRAHLTGRLAAALVVRLATPLAPAVTHDGQWQLSPVCAIRDPIVCIIYRCCIPIPFHRVLGSVKEGLLSSLLSRLWSLIAGIFWARVDFPARPWRALPLLSCLSPPAVSTPRLRPFFSRTNTSNHVGTFLDGRAQRVGHVVVNFEKHKVCNCQHLSKQRNRSRPHRHRRQPFLLHI